MRVVGLILAFFLPVACAMAAEDVSKAEEKGTPLRPEFRHLRENLDFPPVERVTDSLPLSDQANKAGWEPFAPMTDEFEGDTLDESKWWDHNPDWLGRQPALFYPGNVAVKDGKLHLTMKKEEAHEMPQGFHTYTSAAVKSKTTTLYGYYEIKARAMKSAGSSAFWFYNSEPERWTEIDVFEIGCSPKHDKRVFMTVHVFHTPEEKEHWSRGGNLIAPKSLSDDYHVYGLEWDKDVLRYYFDGVLVREGNNTHWHQPLYLNFDSETFPDWFGLPEDKDLPSTFSIEYVRAWKRSGE